MSKSLNLVDLGLWGFVFLFTITDIYIYISRLNFKVIQKQTKTEKKEHGADAIYMKRSVFHMLQLMKYSQTKETFLDKIDLFVIHYSYFVRNTSKFIFS